MDTDWTSALFSPSKARVQQAQAKDWAAVDSWLAKRYGSRLPAFERNEDTLQALLTLANLNEDADEQRSQIERIEKAAHQSLSKRSGPIADEVYHSMLLELTSETHLDTLAETLVALDCSNADASEMARRMIELTSSEFEMSQQLKRTQTQLDALKAEQERVKDIVRELNGDDFKAPPDVVEDTAEWTRSTKQLKAKVAEYEERLSASRPPTSGIAIEDVQLRLNEVASRRQQLTDLETELRAFRDLPPDPRTARNAVEGARDELRKLTSRRDEMFESLVDD